MRKFASLTVACALLAGPLSVVRAEPIQAPLTFVRRSEAVSIILKYAGIPLDLKAKTNGAYPDLLDGEWYIPALAKGLEMGLLSAEKSTGLVYPHRSVTRVEFLSMLTKAFRLTTNIPYQYTDVGQGAWHAQYVGLAWRYKLFPDPNNPNLLQPDRRISHEEATQVITTLMTAVPSLQPKPNMFPVHPVALSEEPRESILTTIAKSLRPTATSEAQSTTAVLSTPQSVKLAILQLIRSRGNVAEQTRSELIEAVNAVRATYNLPPVRSNHYLELSAQRHAKDMYHRGYFSHYTPEGLNYVDRIKGTGYLSVNPEACSCAQEFNLEDTASEKGPDFVIIGKQACSCEPLFSLGENLAKGQLSVHQVMEDWMHSPNHRMNILRPEFEEIGVGLFGDLWVQNFGRLKFE